jgi:hypothetical protein
MTTRKPHATTNDASYVSRALSKLILHIPKSDERASSDPMVRSRSLAKSAARRAAAISTGLSLPPGPVGMLTILPDLLAIWNLQSALVADIASAYGKKASLTREAMVYCLFKHGGAALLRDVVVRAGERFVVRQTSLRVLEELLAKIGVRLSQRVLGEALARYVPLLGAAAIGAYAYYDTAKVAANTIELFSADVVVEPDRGRGDRG